MESQPQGQLQSTWALAEGIHQNKGTNDRDQEIRVWCGPIPVKVSREVFHTRGRPVILPSCGVGKIHDGTLAKVNSRVGCCKDRTCFNIWLNFPPCFHLCRMSLQQCFRPVCPNG